MTKRHSAVPEYPLFAMHDVTGLTGLHARTIRKLMRQGKFPAARKCGHKWFWPRAVVLAFLGLDTPAPGGV